MLFSTCQENCLTPLQFSKEINRMKVLFRTENVAKRFFRFAMSDINRFFEYDSNQIQPSLHSQYYVIAPNEWQGPSPRLNTWATQLRRNIASVASRWRQFVRLDRPGNRTSRPISIRLNTELTDAVLILYSTLERIVVVHYSCCNVHIPWLLILPINHVWQVFVTQ